MEDRELQIKKELIEKAKELAQNPNKAGILKEVTALKKKWHHSYDEESLMDKELEDKFNENLNVVYASLGEIRKAAEDSKKEVISKAKEILNDSNIRRASNKMKSLMDEWKNSGSATKEVDDELWAQFKTLRDEFYDKRQNYYDELNARLAESKKTKEDLIARAQETVDIDNIKELTSKMNSLMDEWKKSGSAGKKVDEELWSKFKEFRTLYYKKKNDYNHAMKEMYAKRTEEKKDIIVQIKRCLACSEFTDEEVSKVKELRKQWKEVGSAGRENEDTLWNEFSSLVNKYFENLRFYK